MKLKSDSEEDLKKFPFINCICCGRKIELGDTLSGETVKIDDEVSMESYIEQRFQPYKPEEQSWKNGDVVLMSCGYLSGHDGLRCYLGICDGCIEDGLKNTRIRYLGNYLSGSGGRKDYTLEELQILENKRCRNITIDKILSDE